MSFFESGTLPVASSPLMWGRGVDVFFYRSDQKNMKSAFHLCLEKNFAHSNRGII